MFSNKTANMFTNFAHAYGVVGLKYNCLIVIASPARFVVKLETYVMFVTFSFAVVYVGCVFPLYVCDNAMCDFV